MLNIKNLSVSIEKKDILKNISMSFDLGKNYCILGKNGSGKSSLCSVIMGDPRYTISDGSIELDTKNLLEMEPDERSREGIFLSFQNIISIKGVTFLEYLRTIYNIHLTHKNPEVKPLSLFVFKKFIKPFLDELDISEDFLSRDINVDFSGWEKRKMEILQLKLIGPKYIILDEIDSGLDVDSFRNIAEMLSKLSSKENTFIIITHYFSILDYIPVDTIYVLENGRLIKTGDMELVKKIKKKGFKNFEK